MMVVVMSAARSHPAYEPAWESLSQHRIPEWFRDAKFGIYTHWGPVTVGAEEGPAGVQWYGRNMYNPESPWFHQKSTPYRSVNEVIDVLVDIVSKNGCMLLNVGPAADGTIPPEAQKLLRGIGRWLRTNGEAVFATRPWKTFGEGPTRNSGGGFSENKDKPYTSADIRFTQSKDGDTLYAIVLGRSERDVTIRSMLVAGRGRVTLLGHEGHIQHHINGAGQLVITPPRNQTGAYAFAFCLKGFQVSLHHEAVRSAGGTITLEGD